MANNEVRIIGGQWKGRKLKFPDRPGLRPTLGRVRETLFNWLAPVIRDACCLDLFAGSGALGFEALSRGAALTLFVEKDRKAARAIEANAQTLEARARVVTGTAGRYLDAHPERYHIIFFDPPFRHTDAPRLLDRLLKDHLEKDGLLYVETSARSDLPAPEGGEVVKQARAGDCTFALFKRIDAG